MRKVSLVSLLAVILMSVSGVATARPQTPRESIPAGTPAGMTAPPVVVTTLGQLVNSEEAGENETQHNVVKYLGYSLFALIVLAVGSGFFKKKKIYRTIHHALAFLLLAVAVLHGILALTL